MILQKSKHRIKTDVSQDQFSIIHSATFTCSKCPSILSKIHSKCSSLPWFNSTISNLPSTSFQGHSSTNSTPSNIWRSSRYGLRIRLCLNLSLIENGTRGCHKIKFDFEWDKRKAMVDVVASPVSFRAKCNSCNVYYLELCKNIIHYFAECHTTTQLLHLADWMSKICWQ